MWNKNERTWTADQAKGKVKQAVGTLTRSDDLRAKGRGLMGLRTLIDRQHAEMADPESR